MKRSQHSATGFTLVELLCVIAIIAILAGLLLVAVSKAYGSARNKMWRIEAWGMYQSIQEHLSTYYGSQKNYPTLSADDLNQKGVFDSQIMDFLRCPHVQYFPIAMSDPDNKVVFRMDNYWLNNQKSPPVHGNYVAILKTNVVAHN